MLIIFQFQLYTFSLANTKDLPETLINIVKTVPRHSSDHKHLFMEGGFFRYPPLPTNIESLKKLNSEELEKVCTFFSAIMKVMA